MSASVRGVSTTHDHPTVFTLLSLCCSPQHKRHNSPCYCHCTTSLVQHSMSLAFDEYGRPFIIIRVRFSKAPSLLAGCSGLDLEDRF